MKGAVYLRVSTDDQIEYSPDAQLNTIKDYAKKNNITIDTNYIFKDEGISGRTAKKRPAFMEMIKTAKNKPKPFDVILVHKFDRFSRSREDSIVYKSLLLREYNIKVISITETIEDDKFSVILEGMLESMAEYYSLNLADEVKKGMTERAKRGLINTYAPYGYKSENKTLVIDEEKAEVIRTIFKKFNDENLGYREIAIYLNDLGLTTRHNNKWENRTIKYILKNPAYCGYVRWSIEKQDTHNYDLDKCIIEKSNFDPIISKEYFDITQDKIKILKSTQRKYSKPQAKIHWLNNLIKCEYCEKTLTRSADTYYQCSGYSKGSCKHSQAIKIEVLEEVVINQFKNICKEKLDININPPDDDKSEIYYLKKLLERNIEKENRIKSAYQNGIDTIEEYKINKQEVIKEQEDLIKKIEKLENSKENKQEIKKAREYIGTVANMLLDKKISIETKHETMLLLIDKMLFNKQNKTLTIFFNNINTKNS